MSDAPSAHALAGRYLAEVDARLAALAQEAAGGGFDDAIDLLAGALGRGGVVQAFGSGHSEAFAMEIAGRAGGLIPTNRIALRDVVLYGNHGVDELQGSSLERSPDLVE